MATDTMQYAGEFLVEHASIITSENVEIGIEKILVQLDLYENMERSAITGTLVISDSVAIQSSGPIIGQEYLRLKIKTPSDTKTEVHNFLEDVMHIFTLNQKVAIGNQQLYDVHLITYEQMKNTRTRINRTLKGSYSDIVTSLLRDDLKSKKQLFIEPTAGNKKIIPSNSRPFDIIKRICNESVSKENNSPTYHFYENMKGYHFRSAESIYAQYPKMNYTEKTSPSRESKTGVENPIQELNKLQGVEISGSTNTLNNMIMGTYGSKIIVHDILNKSVTRSTYNYHDNLPSEKHINYYRDSTKNNGMYSATPLEEGVPNTTRISDYPTRIFVFPTSRTSGGGTYDSTKQHRYNDGGDFTFTPYDPENWIQQRTSHLTQLEDGFRIKIATKGNTAVCVGDLVNIDLDIHASVDSDMYGHDRKDRFYRGAFVVKTIRHGFNFREKIHTTLIQCTKDSVGDRLKVFAENTEPRPLKSKGIVTDFYSEWNSTINR
jgi:hypothetical protein